MAYPVVLYGPDGNQYNTATGTRRTNVPLGGFPYGTQLIMFDGRKYRFCIAGASALVVGNLLQAAANIGNHVDTTAAANAADVRTLTTTLGATLASLDQYFQGYGVISVTPGAGEVYVFDTTPAVASTGSFVGDLRAGQRIRTALTTTSRVDLIKNPYDNVIQNPATASGIPVGVAVVAIAASAFGWVQTRGIASILTAGTVVLGVMVTASTGTAGAIMPYTFTLNEAGPNTVDGTQQKAPVGLVQRVAASTAWSAIFLQIDG